MVLPAAVTVGVGVGVAVNAVGDGAEWVWLVVVCCGATIADDRANDGVTEPHTVLAATAVRATVATELAVVVGDVTVVSGGTGTGGDGHTTLMAAAVAVVAVDFGGGMPLISRAVKRAVVVAVVVVAAAAAAAAAAAVAATAVGAVVGAAEAICLVVRFCGATIEERAGDELFSLDSVATMTATTGAAAEAAVAAAVVVVSAVMGAVFAVLAVVAGVMVVAAGAAGVTAGSAAGTSADWLDVERSCGATIVPDRAKFDGSTGPVLATAVLAAAAAAVAAAVAVAVMVVVVALLGVECLVSVEVAGTVGGCTAVAETAVAGGAAAGRARVRRLNVDDCVATRERAVDV